MKNIYIQYTPDLTISILVPSEKSKELTCGWLLKEANERLKEIDPKVKQYERILALQTVDGKFAVDYWLTLPERSLSIIKDGTVLKAFYQQEVRSKSEEGKISLENFVIESQIGKGAFSNVYLVRRKETGKLFAMKQIKKGDLTGRKRKIVMRERQALLDIDSPNVVTLHYSFQTENHFYFIMDFVPCGDIHMILSRRRLKESDICFYIAETILALNAIHGQSYIYRDLKPENLLLDIDGHIMITDFGLAKSVENLIDLNYSVCGTLQIMAPEIPQKIGYSCLVDYYNLGTLTYELATGKVPVFEEKDRAFLEAKNPEFGNLSADLKDFIKRLLEPNPMLRLGANAGLKEISAHPWMAQISLSNLRIGKVQPPLRFDPGSIKFRSFDPVKKNIDSIHKKCASCGSLNLTSFSFYGFETEEPYLSTLELIEKSANEKVGTMAFFSTGASASSLNWEKTKSLESPTKVHKETQKNKHEEEFESYEFETGGESIADRFGGYHMPLAKSMKFLKNSKQPKVTHI